MWFSPYLGIRSPGGGGGGSQGIGTQPAYSKIDLVKCNRHHADKGPLARDGLPHALCGPLRWTLNWQIMTTHFFFVAPPGNGRAPLFI